MPHETMPGSTQVAESVDDGFLSPYRPPSPEFPAEAPITGIPIPDTVVSHFAAVRPWTRACSIVGFLIALGFTLATISLARHTFGQVSIQEMIQQAPPIFVAQILTSLALAATVALLTFVAAARLWAFSSSIDPLCESMDGADLEVTTFLHQRFWKATGMTTFVLLLWMINFVLIQLSP